jgi:hypothetical protein
MVLAIVWARILMLTFNQIPLSITVNMEARQWSEKLAGRCDWTSTLIRLFIALFRVIVANRPAILHILHITAALGHL